MTAPNPTHLDRARRRQTAASVALLVAVAFLAYWPALTGGFIWDDDTLVTRNALVKAGDGLSRMWFTTEPLDYWPMTNSSFWLEWRLWGIHASGYHVTNLLLHIGSGMLLWAILRRLAIPGAFAAALLFVVHPVNVESVAWIAQRKNTLSLVFFLVSMRCYLEHELRVPPERSRIDRWYWFSLVAFLLAMLSKGSVAILPGLLLLIIWWQRGSVTRSDVRRTAPFFVIAGALTVVNIWFQTFRGTGVIRDVTLVQRLLGAGAVVWFYLGKALLPIGLIFVYPQWDVSSHDIRWWVPLAAVAATTAALVWQRRRPVMRALLLAWLFFCVGLLPVMGLTDVYYMKYSLVSDHYQYIAILAVVAAAAAGLSRMKAAPAVCGAVLIVLGTSTWRECHQYADAETLYRSTLARNPAAWMVHNNLGGLLLDRSNDEEAAAHFHEALRRKPDLAEAHNNLCYASMHLHRMNEAAAECSEALRLQPGSATAHNGLGEALASLGRLAPARTEFEAALRLNARYADAHQNLATVLEEEDRIAEAETHFREAIRLQPGLADAHRHLGDLLQGQQRLDEAVTHYTEALVFDSRYAEAHNNLGVVLVRLGRADEAVAHFKAALALQPDYVDARTNLNKVLRAGGR